MNFFSDKQFHHLVQHQSDLCISIFSPTHRSGVEVQKKDVLKLKNQIQEVENQLQEMDIPPRKIDLLLNEVKDLLDDSYFWSHNSDGVAVFLSEGNTQVYQLPVYFEAMNYIGNEFYLKPLIPLLTKYDQYYLLKLGLQNPELYECTRYNLYKVDIEDITPQRLEDSVGYDYEESMLQFAAQNQKTSGQSTTFHGHADDKATKKTEILKFFKEINNGIQEVIAGTELPLVVACLDYMYPIYESVNTYPHLKKEYISGNPEAVDIIELHEKSWNIMSQESHSRINSIKEKYQEGLSKGLASNQLTDILSAATEGKIDSLFIKNGTDIFGVYDGKDAHLERHRSHQIGTNHSLLNSLVKKAIKTNSRLYLLEDEQMPNEAEEVAAVFRYE